MHILLHFALSVIFPEQMKLIEGMQLLPDRLPHVVHRASMHHHQLGNILLLRNRL